MSKSAILPAPKLISAEYKSFENADGETVLSILFSGTIDLSILPEGYSAYVYPSGTAGALVLPTLLQPVNSDGTWQFAASSKATEEATDDVYVLSYVDPPNQAVATMYPSNVLSIPTDYQ